MRSLILVRLIVPAFVGYYHPHNMCGASTRYVRDLNTICVEASHIIR
nr:MAG TPA: hypothetical protein [Microviridae sp.]